MPEPRRAGFDDLLVQLRIANAMLATQLQKTHEMTQSQLAGLMVSAGAPAPEIAAILGTTVNTVQVTLSRIRKQRRAKYPAAKAISERQEAT